MAPLAQPERDLGWRMGINWLATRQRGGADDMETAMGLIKLAVALQDLKLPVLFVGAGIVWIFVGIVRKLGDQIDVSSIVARLLVSLAGLAFIGVGLAAAFPVTAVRALFEGPPRVGGLGTSPAPQKVFTFDEQADPLLAPLRSDELVVGDGAIINGYTNEWKCVVFITFGPGTPTVDITQGSWRRYMAIRDSRDVQWVLGDSAMRLSQNPDATQCRDVGHIMKVVVP